LERAKTLTVLENVAVVLAHPLYAGNVGAVVRVMGNFGLRDLILVDPDPRVFHDPQLEPMARGGVEILRRAAVAATLAEAVGQAEIALGFTTRLGKRRRDGLDLREAVERIATESPQARVAAVFGREDKGLTNLELERCHWLVRIPTGPDLPSLNLAQAVGLFAYEVAGARRSAQRTPSRNRAVATVEALEGLYAHFEKVLTEIGFIEEENPARMMNEIRRILSRRLPEPRDVRILRGILSKVELALAKAGQEPSARPRSDSFVS
jgi:tRNA (cytidine32/uridine32-2'-O)-methyltransferase